MVPLQFAQVVLDKFQVVLHSPDQIAPVGVLHPLEYHLEKKLVFFSASDNANGNEAAGVEFDSVCEVLGDCQDISEAPCQTNDDILDLALHTKKELHISKSKEGSTFSVACWLQDASKTSSSMTLSDVLSKLSFTSLLPKCMYSLSFYFPPRFRSS